MNTESWGGGVGSGKRAFGPKRLLALAAATGFLAAVSSSTAAAQPSPLSTLVQAQNARMLVLPNGGLLIAEPGIGPNRAVLSFVDSNGDRRTFLGYLPSGLQSVPSAAGPLLIPDGPDGLALVGSSLYIAIGEGDGFRPRTDRPGAIVPNPSGVSSPILASVLRIDFSSAQVFDGGGAPYFLEPNDQEKLLDGATVALLPGADASASASLLAAFRPGIPDAASVYRASHPNGVAVLESSPVGDPDVRSVLPARRVPRGLYVADSGTNRLIRVDLATGRSVTLVRFPDPQDSLTGPPTGGTLQSVRALDSTRLLVTISGAAPGGGSVQIVDGATGATTTLFSTLNSAVDAVVRETSRGLQLFVLEKSAASGQAGTGRVLKFDVDSPSGLEVATGLNDPISLAIDETNGRLLISSRGDGVIFFVPLPAPVASSGSRRVGR